MYRKYNLYKFCVQRYLNIFKYILYKLIVFYMVVKPICSAKNLKK